MNPSNIGQIQRGDVWNIKFDPQVGAEIQKIRPAVVINVPTAGRLPLQIVVPITECNPRFKNFFWMTEIIATESNGLDKNSFADAFQVKSVAIERFVEKRGTLTQTEIDEIAASIVLCIGYIPAQAK